jgi:hypothetical protein
MAAKFFTGLPLDGPDPECVKGYGEAALAAVAGASAPVPSPDHSRSAGRRAVALSLTAKRPVAPVSACNENPLAEFVPAEWSS